MHGQEITYTSWDDLMANAENIVELNCSDNKLTTLPESIGNLTQLIGLYCNNNQLTMLPESIGNLTQMKHMSIERNKIQVLPDSIGALSQLVQFQFDDNPLSKLPRTLGGLAALEILEMSYHKFASGESIQSIGDLHSLKRLKMSGCNFGDLPDSIGNLASLVSLEIVCCNISQLPESIGNLANLEYLRLGSHRELKMLPESISNLKKLKTLDCHSSGIEILPESIGGLTSLEVLRVDYTFLKGLPESIGELRSLKELNISYAGGKQIRRLPESIGNLRELQILAAVNIGLAELPKTIGGMANLRTLYLESNFLRWLPASIGDLRQLTHLYLSANSLRGLPETIGQLGELRQLSIVGNEQTMRTLPVQLIECRRLQEVEYLASLDPGEGFEDGIPAPVQRMLERLQRARYDDEYAAGGGVYGDGQNVHSSAVQASVKQSIYNLFNDTSLQEFSDDELRDLIVGLPTDLLHDETKSALLDYISSTEEHSTLHITFGDLLKKVIGRIEATSRTSDRSSEKVEKCEGEARKDLYQRMNEEMADAECKCFTGRISRLVNVLVGFFDDIRIEISGAEQISVVIALVKARHRIGDEDEVTPEAKAEIRTELEARGYEPGVIDEWLMALE